MVKYFSLHASGSSGGFETPEEVNAHAIKRVRTIFRPGKMIKDALKLSSYQKKS